MTDIYHIEREQRRYGDYLNFPVFVSALQYVTKILVLKLGLIQHSSLVAFFFVLRAVDPIAPPIFQEHVRYK